MKQAAENADNEKKTPEAEGGAADATPETKAEDTPGPADRIRALEEEVAILRDQRMRALAETDNVRKRAQRDQEELAKFAITGFARDMVSVLENLTRAAESATAAKEQGSDGVKSLAEGIDLTLRELLAIFEKFQIKRIDPQGQKFDHNFHQAVVQVESNDVPPGTVVQVVQAGYTIHDRLLRPAMVAVSKAAEATKTVDTTA